MASLYEALDAAVALLAKATWKERDPIKAEIERIAQTFADRKAVLEHLGDAKRGIPDLEARWEIDEVIERLTPPPPPPPVAETPPAANRQLTAADLQVMYDDPRGFVLHKTKVGERWFATQRDQATGQPQTFELRPDEIPKIKTQLAGSPYWVLGAGAGAAG